MILFSSQIQVSLNCKIELSSKLIYNNLTLYLLRKCVRNLFLRITSYEDSETKESDINTLADLSAFNSIDSVPQNEFSLLSLK